MNDLPGFEARADAPGNVLHTYYRGSVTPEILKKGLADIFELSATLKPGFTVLADMSGLESMDIECGAYVAKAMDFFKTKGIGKVIRVVPDPAKDIGINILSIVHYRGKVPIATCETRAEAEKELLR